MIGSLEKSCAAAIFFAVPAAISSPPAHAVEGSITGQWLRDAPTCNDAEFNIGRTNFDLQEASCRITGGRTRQPITPTLELDCKTDADKPFRGSAAVKLIAPGTLVIRLTGTGFKRGLSGTYKRCL